ncbi:hypothetical protein R7Q39_10450 [Vibrio sp. 947]|uniref:Uncharacterized protein n=1 Tax=Vibrio fluvialis PG41 TaxID=1336752 RepID=S7I0F0_VIBFL|nr:MULTISPECIES: hypothetical protein [Vibrio]EPP21534.1 hypothetical protein L910_1213 [Vibrio fluvialis PG41]MDW1584185.1 hypothetical protein [Vibrio sp. Vb2897]MDW1642489.1 hypothetical protein [Vibrio sp. Vb2896]MDW1925836.1 hypothetical protein [Vibrio sp. 947]MDW1966100.1 hypothetical protein [Vibrio sp. Vb0587]
MSKEQEDIEQQEMKDYEQLLEMGVIDEMPNEVPLNSQEKIEDIA